MSLHQYMHLKDPSTRPINSIMAQIAAGLEHIHACRIMHRDIKPANILIGLLTLSVRLADFGIAHPIGRPGRSYTLEVCTLPYRAPEILLGDSAYGPAIDVWSMALIHLELFEDKRACDGDGTLWGTLVDIFKLVGTPDDSTYPGISKLKNYHPEWPRFRPRSPACLPEIAVKALRACPTDRPSAAAYARELVRKRKRRLDCRDNLQGALALPPPAEVSKLRSRYNRELAAFDRGTVRSATALITAFDRVEDATPARVAAAVLVASKLYELSDIDVDEISRSWAVRTDDVLVEEARIATLLGRRKEEVVTVD